MLNENRSASTPMTEFDGPGDPRFQQSLLDRRVSRVTWWLSGVSLFVFVVGVIATINHQLATPFIVPKFEIGGNVAVRVVGPDGKPLEGAMITPHGLRSDQSPGSGFSWVAKLHGPADTVLTDARGEAGVPFPKWVSLESAMLTSGIIVMVEHPEFVFQMNVECPLVGSSAPQVTLAEGGRVRLRVFRTDQTDAVTDFVANISGDSYRKEWKLDGDARVSPVLPLGERFCRVVHFDNERGTQFSERIRFDSRAGKTEDLEVRLQPGLKVRGRLDVSVPRPVSNGFVIAVVADESPDGDYQKCLSWHDWVAVSDQGEFEFAGLPTGNEVRLLAFCDGFVSAQPVLADLPEHMRRNSGWVSLPQSFKVSGPEVNATVLMERAASARFKVVDGFGKPLEGVSVAVSPNVIYSTGSTLFGSSGRPGVDYGKTFANFGEVLRSYPQWDDDSPQPDMLRPKFGAKSDAAGEVIVQNIPARGKQNIYATHDKFAVRGDTRPPFWGDLSMELKPGRDESLTITMEPKPEVTPEMLRPPTPPKPPLWERLKEWLRANLP